MTKILVVTHDSMTGETCSFDMDVPAFTPEAITLAYDWWLADCSQDDRPEVADHQMMAWVPAPDANGAAFILKHEGACVGCVIVAGMAYDLS